MTKPTIPPILKPALVLLAVSFLLSGCHYWWGPYHGPPGRAYGHYKYKHKYKHRQGHRRGRGHRY